MKKLLVAVFATLLMAGGGSRVVGVTSNSEGFKEPSPDLAPAQDAQKVVRLSKGCSVYFATVAEAKTHLAKRDVYIKNLSPFERAAKIKKAGPVSTGQYLAFIQNQTLEWDNADKKKLRQVIAVAKPKLAKFGNHLPERIHLIKTTGNDEGAAPYTRGVSIILPERTIRQSVKSLERLFYHELFHIVSRANPKLRDELYRTIGYEKCGEVLLPDDMMPRRISNPDAPVVEHASACRRTASRAGAPRYCSRARPSTTPRPAARFFAIFSFASWRSIARLPRPS
jgi:hypothetical protein